MLRSIMTSGLSQLRFSRYSQRSPPLKHRKPLIRGLLSQLGNVMSELIRYAFGQSSLGRFIAAASSEGLVLFEFGVSDAEYVELAC